ncbi:transglutaminase-like domain-containing protein [Halalkalibacter urbisdiaboli]|uniref:transglutaminase-like domain-containing protein n=1 Tax=Halalkalibacter urbisdiaboli TaxID=1960589 RepID=UPI000B43C2F9|nr:transglutaminase family protein [Halalkalibacter urbisdiaboli]
MKLILETTNLEEYLKESSVVNYHHPLIQEKAKQLFHNEQSDIEKVRLAFEFVRDEIAHSWDIQSSRITCKASDVLQFSEGICYAKSNLLAALLRSVDIPTGFCYQRLMIFDSPDKGYALHAFNGVYLASHSCWVRIDARGNKQGVEAEFLIKHEKLAFTIHPELNEKDYPIIFATPHPKTIDVLQKNLHALEMYKHHLPDEL